MAELTVPQIDFSTIGNLGQTYNAARTTALREKTLATLGQSDGPVDYNTAAKTLFAAGDPEGGMALAKLGVSQQGHASSANGVYGTPIYGQDANGKTVLGAIGKSGKFVPIDTGGVTVNPGIKTIDTGTGTLVIDSRTGQPVGGRPSGAGAAPMQAPGQTEAPGAPVVQGGYIPKDVAGEASQKTQGTEGGKAVFSLPQTLSKADQSIAVVDRLLTHKGRETATGLSGTLDPRNYIPGTNAKDFRVGLDQLKGQAFLQAFESLKGGGAISEVEGAKATQAIARLDTAQSDGEFKAALAELKGVLVNGKQRAIQMARQGQGAPQQQAQPQQRGPVRVNTPDEARRLPSGTPIMLPDGTVGRVP